MSFWVLPVTVNLNGLAKTGAMKVNCDHETTLKASIISLIQLIGGITVYRSDSLRKGRATTKQQTDYGGNYFFIIHYHENSGHSLATVVSCGASKTACGETTVSSSGIFLP